jgi:KaiC/GvpD/RAD55 family RecA-like ATPase
MYEFRIEDAYDFARHVGIQAKNKGEELMFNYCPYCRGGANRKDKGTFSINLKTGQCKCLRASCGVSGNLVTLSKDFDFSLGMVDEYYRPKKEYKKLKTPSAPIEPKPEAVTYLESRGISEEVAKRYEITTQTEHTNILVFPFYDEKGILQFVKYRKTDFDKSKDKNKEWCEANCKPILFGMKQCVDFSRLVITEGQLDSLSVATAGIDNAVSVPTGAKGFTWLPYCWDWINQFQEVIVFGDCENGKITLLDELSTRLKTTVKHVSVEDYKGCKDANEILNTYGIEQIKVCINNAKRLPMKQIVDLADVQDENPYLVEKLATGIRQIDNLLHGGLPFGGLVLICGKRGEGKSTMASEILANAIEQDYTCFAYSGELPNRAFKSIIDMQVAGPQHITEGTNKDGKAFNLISKTNKDLIAEWYRGKCLLYDNGCLDDEETESLIKTTENVIMQYGVRVILLDNLMTAIDLEKDNTSDKHEKQSLFVKKLARLALRHNVLIILVAHKRKNNFSTDENDEISGSGDISNLASVIISYEKDKDEGQYQRVSKITKNRLFGQLELNGFKLNYDFKSKRIYGLGDDMNKEYSWNKASDGFCNYDMDSPFD